MSAKGICKQLEKEKEDNFESFDLLVSFWRYNKDANMHRSCCHRSLGSRIWCITAESGGVSSFKKNLVFNSRRWPLGEKKLSIREVKFGCAVSSLLQCNIIY